MAAIEELVKGRLEVKPDERSQRLYHDNYQAVLAMFNERHKRTTYNLSYALKWLTDEMSRYCGYKLKEPSRFDKYDY